MSGPRRETRPSIVGRVLAWYDLRSSMRWLLDAGPREGTLLALALLSGLVWFLGRMAELWLSPAAATMGEAALIGRAQGELVAAIFLRTLMLYALAGLAGLVARACGGTGSWKDSRAATFWAAVVAAPVMLAATVIATMVGDGPGPAAAMFRSIGGVAFAWAFSFCLAEAHGFRSGVAVLAVVAALGLVVMLPFYVLG